MIVEAAKRGIQVHFTAMPDTRTTDQRLKDDQDHFRKRSSYLRGLNDQESQFIRLTAHDERFAVITTADRMAYDNSFDRQFRNTKDILISEEPPKTYPGAHFSDYYYALANKELGSMKMQDTAPATIQPNDPAMPSNGR